eukprot:UN3797
MAPDQNYRIFAFARRVHAALLAGHGYVGESATEHHEEGEGEVVHLVDNLPGLELRLVEVHREQAGQPRRQVEVTHQELIAEYPPLEHLPREAPKKPPRYVLAGGDQLLHLLLVFVE